MSREVLNKNLAQMLKGGVIMDVTNPAEAIIAQNAGACAVKNNQGVQLMSREVLNKNLAQMLKGGVIMDVTNPAEAIIAQNAGACAVMALERVPSDIRKEGGVARMSDPKMIKEIQEAVSIPVMAKVRIGHFVEAQILEALEIDFIDESEVLTPADNVYHIEKTKFEVPFVCGARNLGEALRRIGEGAAMIRTKGEAGTKGGVIMDVTNPAEAIIAQNAGACAVMALERVPSDIRKEGGVARMSDPKMIKEIQEAVSIPVMAKVRIGHFVEAQILEALEIDFIDESEVLTPADNVYHIEKTKFEVPFVCGARNLGEALRRIGEGAAMIRTKGEAGTGDVVEAVKHMRTVTSQIRKIVSMGEEELMNVAKEMGAPYDLIKYVHENGKLPVVNFAAGGIATPADAALMMQLGCDGVFVGSGIFKSDNPEKRAEAIVKAVTNYNNPKVLAEISEDLGGAMSGVAVSSLEDKELLAARGW